MSVSTAVPVRFAMVSGERGHLDQDENRDRTNALGEALLGRGLSIRPAKGMFEGVSEASYQVKVPHDRDLAKVLELAREFDQLAVLVVDEYSSASLYDTTIDTAVEVVAMPLGRWVEVTREQAEDANGWTYLTAPDGQGQWWVVV